MGIQFSITMGVQVQGRIEGLMITTLLIIFWSKKSATIAVRKFIIGLIGNSDG